MITAFHAAKSLHRSLLDSEKKETSFIWQEEFLDPFDELILSWKAGRPIQGSYLVQVSLKIAEWSPWLDYAYWGASNQYSFRQQLSQFNAQTDQDIVQVLRGHQASGFKIRIIAQDIPSLDAFERLHVSLTDRKEYLLDRAVRENVLIQLHVPCLSQMALVDERRLRLCSPTSTAAALRFLSPSLQLSPIEFADRVFDSAFDIYGNWVLNAAQASQELGKEGYCFVVRLSSFDQIIEQLCQGYPVIVSVQGPLSGSAFAYAAGHLLVVKGYDSKK